MRYVLAGAMCLGLLADGVHAQVPSSAAVQPKAGESANASARPGFRLWSGADPVPDADAAALVPGVRFSMIKRRQPEVDGYDWLHGVAVIRYRDTWFASWGNNQGKENTAGEVARGARSRDDGRTWSAPEDIGPAVPGEARSHGVFLVRGGSLWAFHARYGHGEGRFRGLGMEAFVLDDTANIWHSQGVVAQSIWPLREPERLADGNWFVPGCDENWRAAVALSRGDDVLHWDTVRVPVGDKVYTEASAWVDGNEITLVMRNQSPRDPREPCAAVSVSRDYGRTWSPPEESNLPLSTSKPYCGRLTTGQRYLIGNSLARQGKSRSHLTIAVSRPGEKTLSRLWRIRDADSPEPGGKPQHMAYPHAVEYDGQLYVAYSASAASGNRNNAELAVLPVKALAAGPSEGESDRGAADRPIPPSGTFSGDVPRAPGN